MTPTPAPAALDTVLDTVSPTSTAVPALTDPAPDQVALDTFAQAALQRGSVIVDPDGTGHDMPRRYQARPANQGPAAVALHSIFGLVTVLNLTGAAPRGRFRLSADGTLLRAFYADGTPGVTYRLPRPRR
ncbi:hypothetical protein [Nocardioides sp. Leaf285]|uniref:hypothetical protein n=1 Tax=Nocardioides sp. Leaf285 TaxID=1736322 RepID=UPI00070349E9|nr:hypothetical protein [Nocardioides sp. Leaf285]KQP63181.1 hypothetical protein ASF47_19415 [Nocardioides sp. Leaf285]